MSETSLQDQGNGHLIDIDPTFESKLVKSLADVRADKPLILSSIDPDVQTDPSISDEYFAYLIKFLVRRAILTLNVQPKDVTFASGISIADEFHEYFKIYFLEPSTARSSYIQPEEQMVKPKLLPRVIRGASFIFIGCAIGLTIYNYDAFLILPHFTLVTILGSIVTIWVTYLGPFRNT